MGVLNVTPDSFFDGGQHASAEGARRHVDVLLAAGADIVDIGGESSRPGAAPVPAMEQIERIEPAVRHALASGALVSIDTTDPVVADRMLELGAELINDISCLADPELARVCARHEKTLILMHARGAMQGMSGFSDYPDDAYGSDVVAQVLGEWRAAASLATRQGLEASRIWFDPGLGFNKNARQSFELLRGLSRFRAVGTPVVVGASRKSFIAAVDRKPPEERLGGSIAAALLAVERGASVLRVHDVAEVHQALVVARAIQGGLSAVEAPRV
jgi:dihydropteroate synthase